MSFLVTIRAAYVRVLSLREFEGSTVLRLMLGALALSYYVTFIRFFYRTDTTAEGIALSSNVCWPYFQQCRELLFLHTLPYGYSQPILYMVLFAALLGCIYFLFKRNTVAASALLLPSFLWHLFVTLALTNTLTGNYDYYIIIIGLVVLFLPHKLFFARLSLVLFYFLSTAAKIHPTWVLGTYFSSLQAGLPIFPDAGIPVWTNLVIGMEMIGAWLLLSGHHILQRLSLIFFAIFHVYSGVLVGYLYPSIVLPFLLILFGPLNSYTPVPFDRRALLGWLLVVSLFAAQLFSLMLVPGDAKLTLEGNRYGMYMFESNHQCVSNASIAYEDGESEPRYEANSNASFRCDPYDYWFRLHARCEELGVTRIGWTFDHSINGGPFYRIVDVSDLCPLEYKAFSHNTWIQTEHDDPDIVGYPVKNYYR